MHNTISSQLVDIWKNTSDEKLLAAMRRLDTYEEHAHDVIRDEFYARGLSTEAPEIVEPDEWPDDITEDVPISVAENVHRYVFPKGPVILVRLIGVMAGYTFVVSLLREIAQLQVYGRLVPHTLESVSWMLALGAYVLWSALATVLAFRKTRWSWPVLVGFVGGSIMETTAEFLSVFIRKVLYEDTFGWIRAQLHTSNRQFVPGEVTASSDIYITTIVSIGLLASAVVVLYSPSVRTYLNVTPQHRTRARWLLIGIGAFVILAVVSWTVGVQNSVLE